MQIEDIWLCWRLALLRVASSTSDRFESNVIKLFFFEIPLYVNRAAGSVHFLCKSEYLYRTFAHSESCNTSLRRRSRMPSLWSF